jgi:hypothetical protein
MLAGDSTATLEHPVLKKMGETRLPDFFPCGANVVSNVNMYNGIAMVFMNDQSKPVWQYIFFIRYNDLISLFGDFFNKPGLAGNNGGAKEGKPGKQQHFLFHNRNFGY